MRALSRANVGSVPNTFDAGARGEQREGEGTFRRYFPVRHSHIIRDLSWFSFWGGGISEGGWARGKVLILARTVSILQVKSGLWKSNILGRSK